MIADQAPGSEPPPPTITAPVTPPPTGFDPAAPYAAGGYTTAPADEGLAGRVRALPTWGKVLAPLVVVAVLALALLFTSGGDSDDGKTETAGTASATLDEAVDAARAAGLSDDISDARAAALIGRICSAATRPSDVADLGQDLGELPATSTSDLRKQIRALGVGAEERCPSDLEAEPELIDDLQDAALVAYSTTTTAVTLMPDGSTDAGVDGGVDGGTDSGTTGTTKAGSRTTTTKKGSTATTKAPTTTTTKAVPKALPNQPCSPNGATGENKITGKPMTCGTCRSGKWNEGPCMTNPPPPTTQPGQTIPTNTTTTTSA